MFKYELKRKATSSISNAILDQNVNNTTFSIPVHANVLADELAKYGNDLVTISSSQLGTAIVSWTIDPLFKT